MKSLYKTPPTPCAFHQHTIITHFCKYYECLLPLCHECLPIHHRQHSTKQSPADLILIQQQSYLAFKSINEQVATLDNLFTEMMQKIKKSNQLHGMLKIHINNEKSILIEAIGRYYESLNKEVDLNQQRRTVWLQEMTTQYHQVRHELFTIQQKLQGQKHLRTIIMWNRLKPQAYITDIQKQVRKDLQPPSIVPCDYQKIVNYMSQNQSMTVLDLQGDMGFGKLSKILYTLRYGPQESIVSTSNITNKNTGLSVISKGNHRLSLCRSADKI